jgi:hypothetical protein
LDPGKGFVGECKDGQAYHAEDGYWYKLSRGSVKARLEYSHSAP